MKKSQVINIEIDKALWKEFGILCMQMDQTRKESMQQALELFIRENSQPNVYTLKKTKND